MWWCGRRGAWWVTNTSDCMLLGSPYCLLTGSEPSAAAVSKSREPAVPSAWWGGAGEAVGQGRMGKWWRGRGLGVGKRAKGHTFIIVTIQKSFTELSMYGLWIRGRSWIRGAFLISRFINAEKTYYKSTIIRRRQIIYQFGDTELKIYC